MMTRKTPKTVAALFQLLPKSEEKMAQQIGISTRTIRSLKNGKGKASMIVRHKIHQYIRRLMQQLSALLPDEKIP